MNKKAAAPEGYAYGSDVSVKSGQSDHFIPQPIQSQSDFRVWNNVAPLVLCISNYFRFPTVEVRQLVARYRAAFMNEAS